MIWLQKRQAIVRSESSIVLLEIDMCDYANLACQQR